MICLTSRERSVASMLTLPNRRPLRSRLVKRSVHRKENNKSGRNLRKHGNSGTTASRDRCQTARPRRANIRKDLSDQIRRVAQAGIREVINILTHVGFVTKKSGQSGLRPPSFQSRPGKVTSTSRQQRHSGTRLPQHFHLDNPVSRSVSTHLKFRAYHFRLFSSLRRTPPET